MKKILCFIFTLIIISSIFINIFADETENKIYAIDYETILTDESKAIINACTSELQKQCNSRIFVLTTPEVEKDIKQTATDTFLNWNLTENDVLLVVSGTLHNYYIYCGSSISKTIKRAEIENILKTDLEPQFNTKNYDDAITKTVEHLSNTIQETTSHSALSNTILIILIIAICIIISILISKLIKLENKHAKRG